MELILLMNLSIIWFSNLIYATLYMLTCFKIVGVPDNYRAFVDYEDGYSYYYPSDWRVSCYMRMQTNQTLKNEFSSANQLNGSS